MEPAADHPLQALPPLAVVRVGQVFGPYRLVEKVGEGGMAEVYKAFHLRLERYEALKFILPHIAAEPTFRQRFEKEARLLAQLSHPNIVPIHAFGEEGPHCYLAMEYVTGGTLKDALEKTDHQGLTLPEVARLLQQIGAALDYIHQHHIIHRDLKPANIMLTPDGRVLLSDFGIAKLLEAQAALTQTDADGTPAYMSPEQLMGEVSRIGPTSDVYGLGIMLYEMLTGRLPFSAASVGELAIKQLNEPAPTLRPLRPDTPEAVEAVVLKALAKDPARRFSSAGEMAYAFLEAAGPSGQPAATTATPPAWWPVPDDTQPAPGDCPFKGLQYFDEADADLFFGRELLVAKLVGYLREHNFLAVVVGASGSGKSSIVRAGVVPALKRRVGATTGQSPLLADGTLPPEGSADWPIHVLAPGAHPLEALALSLTRDSESVTAATTLTDDLARDARALHFYVRKLLSRPGAAKHLLLVVDQFEELFTLCADPAERQALVDNLLTAVAGPEPSPTILILTLRADFYAHCAQYPNLRQAVARHQEYIGAMTADELRRAIEEPARRANWDLEPGLVETLLKDVGDEPGALPLLSHALLETWQRRQGRRLTLRGYALSGGVRGAIARTADAVYGQLPPDQQAIARNLFLRLTELGEGAQDTRRRAALAELAPRPEDGPAVERVLKTLTDARLITTTADSAEVSHEALIREWPRLRAWLDEDRAGLRAHRQLTEAAQEWARREREAGLLFRGVRLAEAGEWAAAHHDALNALEREFLSESRAAVEREAAEKEAQRQRELAQTRRLIQTQRQRSAVLAVGLVIATLLMGIALALYQQSNQNLAVAVEQAQMAFSRQLVLQEVSLKDKQLDLALVLGVEAVNTANTIEARANLLSVLQNRPRLQTYLRSRADMALAVAFSPNGKTLAAAICKNYLAGMSACGQTEIHLWDMRDPARVKPLGVLLAGPLYYPSTLLMGNNAMAFSPDSQTLVWGGCQKKGYQVCQTGNLIRWDVSDPAQTRPLGTPLTLTVGMNNISFSPSGRTLASINDDRTVRLWDVSDPAQVKLLGAPLTDKGGPNSNVAFSPDGRTLAWGNLDKNIVLWDVSDPAQPQPLGAPLTGLTGSVTNIAFSPDGKTLASASCVAKNVFSSCEAGALALWDVSDPAQAGLLGVPLTSTVAVNRIRLSPDGETLAVSYSDATIRLWDVSDPARAAAQGAPLTGHTASVFGLAYDPNGQTLASGDFDGNLFLWDVSDPARLKVPLGAPLSTDPAIVRSVTFSLDGKVLASGGTDNAIQLWDMSDPARPQPLGMPLTGHTAVVLSVAFSPDGKVVASGSDDNTIRLWDVRNPAQPNPLGAPLTGHAGGVNSVAFSPVGKTLASGSSDETIRLWDVRDPAQPQPLGAPLTGYTATVLSVAFSPDGKTLASGSVDGLLRLWDVSNPAQPQPLGAPLTGRADSIHSLAFSPDGKTLASGGCEERKMGEVSDNIYAYSICTLGGINLWDVSDPAHATLLASALTRHTDYVTSVAFSPDGKMLASGSWDTSIMLWDVSDPARASPLGAPLTGHTGWVSSVAFSPDGQTLASGSQDKTIIVWDVSVESAKARACRIANRNLTPAEWAQYMGGRSYHPTCPEIP